MKGARGDGTLSSSPRLTATRPFGRPAPLHVILLPAVPVLALWAGNASEVRGWGPLGIAAALSLAAVALTGIFTVVQRDVRRSGLAATGVLLIFSVHGHLVPQGWGRGQGLTLSAVLALIVLAAAGNVPPNAMARGTTVINVVGIALVVANSAVVVVNRPGPVGEIAPETELTVANGGSGRPDVWYLVPDRYPDLDRLEAMGIDTHGFEQRLEARGFQVADSAWANYPETSRSLASSWNVTTLPVGPDSIRRAEAVEMLRNPRLGTVFRQAGYDYLHLGTWFETTASSASATDVLTLEGSGEFYFAFDQGSMLPSLRAYFELGVPYLASDRARQIAHALHQFATLHELASPDHAPGSRFVLSHITLPHRPFVFHADGSIRADPPPLVERALAYEEQLQHFNRKLLSLIDELQSRPDPPVILIMADEGVAPDDVGPLTRDAYDFKTLTPEQIRNQMSILAAVYDPVGRIDLPPEPTALEIIGHLLGVTINVDVDMADTPSYFWTADAPGLIEVSDLLSR